MPRVRDIVIDYPNADALFQFARNTVGAMARGFPAPLKCIDAVAAAVAMPFDDGLRYERELFIQLAQTPESRALRHAFFAERAAAKIPDVPSGTAPRAINAAAVIGAGTMGGGIAICLLDAGIPVTLLETKQEALDKGVTTIRQHYDKALAKGRLTAAELARRMALLKPTLSYDDLADADLIIEAVFEDLAVKKLVFERLDAVAKPAAILASNTSTLDLNKIAGFTARPQNVVGMHFFSPANVMKLLEVVRGARTGKRCAGHRHERRQEDAQDRGRLGRMRRLHRQPHDRAVSAPGAFSAGRGRVAGAGRSRAGEIRHGDGSVSHERSRRQRRRLVHPQAPLRREAATSSIRASPTGFASSAASARRPASAGTGTSRDAAMRCPIRRSTR